MPLHEHTDFMNLVRLHPDSILIADAENKILFANTSGMRLLCRLPSSHDYLPACMDLVTGTEQIISVIDIAGNEVVLDIEAQEIQWQNQPVRFICIADISDETREKRRLKKLVYTDHLTGLYNRRGLEQLSVNILASSKRRGMSASLFYIDVNRLKQINDSLGHATGDAAIIETSELLKNSFRECDVSARIGGDEFVVLVIEEEGNTKDVIFDRIQRTIDKNNKCKNRQYKLSLSIGVIPIDDYSIPFSELLDKADRQMYVAKRFKKRNRNRSLSYATEKKHFPIFSGFFAQRKSLRFLQTQSWF